MGNADRGVRPDGLERYKSTIERLEGEGFMYAHYTGTSMNRHGMKDSDGTPFTVMVDENIWQSTFDNKARRVVLVGGDGETSSIFEARGPYLSLVPNNFDMFKRAIEEIKVYRIMTGGVA